MTSTTIDTPEEAIKASIRDRIQDASCQTAHLSHEARRLRTLAADAVEDGVHAAKRAMTSARRGVEKLGDFKDEAVHRVKRQPLGAVGLSLGIGLVVGLAAGWIGRGSMDAARRGPSV
jgi:ElaB/YqjD/DUF883 family membrane-anchored ribosome-binding protein